MIWYRATWAFSPRRVACCTSISTANACERSIWSPSCRTAASKLRSRRITGSIANERSRSVWIVARSRSRAPSSRLGASSALPERSEGGVVHERDAGQRLERAVVEENNEAPPLVLLGGDELRGEPGALGRARAARSSRALRRRRARPEPSDRGAGPDERRPRRDARRDASR